MKQFGLTDVVHGVIPSVLIVRHDGSGDYRCSVCQAEIPPGKPGRRCRECRDLKCSVCGFDAVARFGKGEGVCQSESCLREFVAARTKGKE